MKLNTLATLCYWGVIVSSCFFPLYLDTHNFTYRALAVGGVVLFYIGLIPALNNKFSDLRSNPDTKSVLYYLGAVFIVFCMSLTLNSTLMTTLLTHPYSFLAFFIAIVSLTVNLNSLNTLTKISNIITAFFPVIAAVDLAVNKAPIVINQLAYFVLFALLVDKGGQKFIRLLYLLLLIIGIVWISVVFGNRTMAMRFAGVTLLFLTFKYISFLNWKAIKWVIFSGALSLMIFIITFFEKIFIHLSELSPNKDIDTTDTRTFIFTEFLDTFKGMDWIYGRGFLGTYYSSYFFHHRGKGSDAYIRFTAEVGIIDIMLKGGFLILIPFLYLLIRAVYKGFILNPFKSLSFKFSLLVLVDLFLLSIENYPDFSVHYMVLWLAVGIIFMERKAIVVQVVTQPAITT